MGISDDQIEQLVQLCLRAYTPAETSVKNMVGGDLSLLDGFFRASIRAGTMGGGVYVATEESDHNIIRGMALWDDQQRELHAFISKLSPEAQEWHRKTYVPEFANLTEKLLGPRGKIDSWRAGSSKLNVAATNELNVGIYRRLGFQVKGSMLVDDFPVFVLSNEE
ncbi:N-acetyltransferase domain-containing protein [Favolaschia claudopus]|uniref:N-acetyltransferase domain-containing protein n=1 Tax=Favolaschia claudopus TaxID=2862362 RepID=A0AAW0EKP2_9AGAR